MGENTTTYFKILLDYFKKKRHELGYDVEFNESYHLIETIYQLREKLTLVGIIVPSPELSDSLDTGLTFDCTWDIENGVGVRLIKGEITKVGYQDGVM